MGSTTKGWGIKIEELSKKAASAKDDVKVKYEKQIKILKDKQVEGAKKLDQIESSADAAWDEVKAGAENVWHEMKSTMGNAMSKFKPPSEK
ncbi:MAG TPA: hypothetical protein VGB89_02375 [Bacteroidota bacterium]